MDVFFENTAEDHLPGMPESSQEVPHGFEATRQPWFWVVHPGVDPRTFMEDGQHEARVQACLKFGGSILFGSKAARCGLTEEAATLIEKDAQGHIHVLRVSLSSAIEERLRKFLEEVRGLPAGAKIPWHTLEPDPWPPNLVAIYLFMKALQLTAPEQRNPIRDGWRRMPDEWKRSLWESARREFRERTGNPIGEPKGQEARPSADLGDGDEDLDNPEKIERAVTAIFGVLARKSSP